MKTIRILILEDDLKTLAVIMDEQLNMRLGDGSGSMKLTTGLLT